MRPTATDGCTGNTLPINNPRIGMMVYCNKTPRAICFGFFRLAKKSSNSRVKPMPNIVNANALVIMSPLNQVTLAGLVMPTSAPRSTQRGNKFVNALIVWMNGDTVGSFVLVASKFPFDRDGRDGDVIRIVSLNLGFGCSLPSAPDWYVKLPLDRACGFCASPLSPALSLFAASLALTVFVFGSFSFHNLFASDCSPETFGRFTFLAGGDWGVFSVGTRFGCSIFGVSCFATTGSVLVGGRDSYSPFATTGSENATAAASTTVFAATANAVATGFPKSSGG
mmetsp:Transcript_9121/g.30406  ORF Transcript_9121/g.30406 Transcript_9121/m.30406 type:complete len:281 (+) Transcript_9121:716-1558(+)